MGFVPITPAKWEALREMFQGNQLKEFMPQLGHLVDPIMGPFPIPNNPEA